MSLTRALTNHAVAFTFSTKYKGKNITLTIIPSVSDRFSVMQDDTLLGQIKVGYYRHTWYVIGGDYIEYVLVNQIAQKILEQSY